MKLFRAKPVTVEAVEWTGDNRAEWYSFWGIEDLGNEIAWPSGYWAVRMGHRINVVEGDVFNASYEPLL